MEKAAPASPRRQASLRGSLQRTSLTNRDDGQASQLDARDEIATHSSHADPSQDATLTLRIDRTVRTRTHDRITLALPLADDALSPGGEPSSLLRGWRSPHGEPYKPLGDPNLGFKFSPRLHSDAHVARSPAETLSAKDTTAGKREPSTTTASSETKPPPSLILDMFPRNLRKRPPDDRHAKLALKLQESMAQYSPEKTHGLARRSPSVAVPQEQEDDDDDVHTTLLRLQAQHRGDAGSSNSSSNTSPALSSPRPHTQHGDASFHLLRDAVHDGAARLQLVRNGQSFLSAVPFKSELSLDLQQLKHTYDSARAKNTADEALHKSKTGSHTTKPVDDESDEDEILEGHHPCHGAGTPTSDGGEASRLYLPYTTRVPQRSPFKQLPTLSEFKATQRDERLPLRTGTGRVSMTMMMRSESPRKPASPRSSGSPRTERRVIQSIEALAPSTSSVSPLKLNRMQSRRGSVVLASSVRRSTIVTGPSEIEVSTLDPDSDALARAVASYSPDASSSSSLSKVHSVVRLQHTLDSVETVKHTQAQALAETLSALDHDRRECLETKFRHVALTTQWKIDIPRMRTAAELDRVETRTLNVVAYRWYPELLRHVLASNRHGLHPAETFCLDVIRSTARDGHAFQHDQLFQLVLLLHADDVAVPNVQQLLTFLKRALGITTSDWTAFFHSHNLREPTEVFFTSSEESTLKHKKKLLRLAKLRSVVRIHQVLRRLTTPPS